MAADERKLQRTSAEHSWLFFVLFKWPKVKIEFEKSKKNDIFEFSEKIRDLF